MYQCTVTRGLCISNQLFFFTQEKKSKKELGESVGGDSADMLGSPMGAQSVSPVQTLQSQFTPVTMAEVGNFEQMWGAHPQEVNGVVQLPVPNIDLDELAKRIQDVSNIGKVWHL